MDTTSGPSSGPSSGSSEGKTPAHAERPRRLPSLPQVAGIVVALALGGVGLVALFHKPSGPTGAHGRPTGTIRVTSTPSNAAIFVDGLPTPYTTPAEIEDVELETGVRLAVMLAGHVASPTEATVRVPADQGVAEAHFELRKGRPFQIVTDPPNANVVVNGIRQKEVTPLTIAVANGVTASVAVSLEGHLPVQISVSDQTGTATVARLKLQPGREIDVTTVPSGASVHVDGSYKGDTPLYGVLVPIERGFSIQIDRPGYQPWKRRMKGAAVSEGQLSVQLQARPLLELALSPEERVQAAQLEKDRVQLEDTTARTQKELEQAQTRLASLEKKAKQDPEAIATLQTSIEAVQAKLLTLEAQKNELERQTMALRDQVVLRLEAEKR